MKKMSKRMMLAVLTVIISISLNLPAISFAEQISTDDVIAINKENFPDDNFLSYIESNFDTNKDGNLDKGEIANVTGIGIKGKGVRSLKGIEYFTNIRYLNVGNNYIETLDLSKNTNLVVAYCNNNIINSVKLPNQEVNNTLEILDLFDNALTEVNLHNLKALKFLYIGDNRLTNIDLSDNPLNEAHGFIANYNFIEKITLPNNNVDYPWTEFLSTQLFPGDKSIGYKVQWYLDEEKTQILDPNTTKTVNCVGQTLYAEYVPITYTIQFNPGQGIGETKTQEFKYGISQKLLKNDFTKSGYQFAGWKDNKGRIYEDEADIKNLTDTDGKTITLTATWKERDYSGEKYIINLYDGENFLKSIEATYENKIELPKSELSKEGFNFLGWNFGNGNYSIYSDEGKILITNPNQLNGKINESGEKSLDLYAVWEKAMLDSTVTITTDSLDKIYDGNLVLKPSVDKIGSTKEVIFTWYEMKGYNWVKLEDAPANVGRYKVVASVEVDDNYNGASAELQFEISKAMNSWTQVPSIEGWEYGSENNNPVGESKFGEVEFTYSNSENGTFTKTVPTEAGKWFMKATVQDNENYTGLEKVVSFVIEEKSSVEDKPSIDDDSNIGTPDNDSSINTPDKGEDDNIIVPPVEDNKPTEDNILEMELPKLKENEVNEIVAKKEGATKFNIVLKDSEAIKSGQGSLSLILNDVNIKLPFSAIDGNLVDENDEVKLSLNLISDSEIVKDLKAVNKVFDFDMIINKENEDINIHNFKDSLAEITINLTDEEIQGLNKDKLKVYYYNEETKNFEVMESKVEGNNITFKTSHFSKYIIAEEIVDNTIDTPNTDNNIGIDNNNNNVDNPNIDEDNNINTSDKEDNTVTITSDNETKPNTDNSNTNSTINKEEIKAETIKEQLPETGSKVSSTTILVLAIGIVVIGGTMFFRKRKHA